MENFCKPKIEEKVYTFTPTEQNIRNDSPKGELRNTDCRKWGVDGIFKKSDGLGRDGLPTSVCTKSNNKKMFYVLEFRV